jgi:hypothetical protein
MQEPSMKKVARNVTSEKTELFITTQQTTKGETAQQQTQTLNQLYKQEKKKAAGTSKGGSLPNLPSTEDA